MKRLEFGPFMTPKFIGSDVTYCDRVSILPNTVVWDLEQTPLPFADNSFDEVMASHVFEHISPQGMYPLINEIHRIIKPGGTFHIWVPHFRFEVHSKSLDHKQFFNRTTFLDFTPQSTQTSYFISGLKPWKIIELRELSRFTFILKTTSQEGSRLKGRLKWLRPIYWWVHDWNHLWIPAEIQAKLTPIKDSNIP